MITAAELSVTSSAGLKKPIANSIVAPPPDAAKPNDKGNGFRLLALAGLTVALVALCVLLSVPFLPAITWGVALAIMAWPIHRLISRYVERPRLAAGISTLAVALLIVVPGLLITYQLAREAAVAAEQAKLQGGGNGLKQRLAELPVFSDAIAWMDRMGIDVETEARKLIASYTQDITSLAHGSIASIIQFLVAIFILYHLFKDRGLFLHGMRDLLPLTRTESDRVFTRAADSVHANLYAYVLTSLINSTSGTLLFWILGIPSPLMWGVIMLVVNILPIVGNGMVWVPAAVYLALGGQWPSAVAVVVWGLSCFVFVDNLLYCRLAGQRMRLHDVPVMISFLGGLAVFGVSGMILGPAILAITVAFLEVWRGRLAQTDTVLPVGAALFVPGDASGARASP